MLIVLSYYTSKPVADTLYDRDTFICGTMKVSMGKGCPLVFIDKKSELSKKQLWGDAVFIHTDISSIVNWKDFNCVPLLYTLPMVFPFFLSFYLLVFFILSSNYLKYSPILSIPSPFIQVTTGWGRVLRNTHRMTQADKHRFISEIPENEELINHPHCNTLLIPEPDAVGFYNRFMGGSVTTTYSFLYCLLLLFWSPFHSLSALP